MSTARRADMRALARTQYHVISRQQARALGADRRQIQVAVESGEWEWATPRVLRLVGGRGSYEQLCMIAVLHTGGWLCAETTLALCRVPVALGESPFESSSDAAKLGAGTPVS